MAMKNVLWLLVGAVAGVAVARVLGARSNTGGSPAPLRDRARAFSSAAADSYRARQAELRDAIAGDS
jgi:hypothetical protein